MVPAAGFNSSDLSSEERVQRVREMEPKFKGEVLGLEGKESWNPHSPFGFGKKDCSHESGP